MTSSIRVDFLHSTDVKTFTYKVNR